MNLFLEIVALAGRVLFALIFISSGFKHLKNLKYTIIITKTLGVPYPKLSALIAGLMSLFGGLSIAFGFYAQIGSVLIILFLLPITFVAHSFWGLDDQKEADRQKIHFQKNIALVGGGMVLIFYGSGPFSLISL